jgi:hypothetical protein
VGLAFAAHAQARMSPKQYIDTYDQDAVREMLKSGVPASITLAQGMLESDYGNSDLATQARNHFGIKCHSSWRGKRMYKDDDAKGECFRVYQTAFESYKDHSEFLKNNRRYAFLFDYKPSDYKSWAHGLKKAGYATNPKYPELLIKIIEENNLQRFDVMTEKDLKALGGKSIDNSETPVITSSRSTSGAATDAVLVSPNGIKYAIAKLGDTPDIIARRYNLGRWQLPCYNEVNRKYEFRDGEKVYLQPKRRKYRGDTESHTVKNGETLWQISQFYGIKQRLLARRNSLVKNATISPGQVLRLR